MKIITVKEFYSLPEGTLFTFAYDAGPGSGCISIKVETIFSFTDENIPQDFLYSDLYSPDLFNSNLLDELGNTIFQFKNDAWCGRKDGMYEDDRQLCVFEEEDVRQLMEVLNHYYPTKIIS